MTLYHRRSFVAPNKVQCRIHGFLGCWIK